MKTNPIPYVKTLAGIEDLNLTPQEAFIFSRVNGYSTLGEIASMVGLENAEVFASLQRCMDAGFIEFKESSTNVQVTATKAPPKRLEREVETIKDSVLPKQPQRSEEKPSQNKAQAAKRFYEMGKQDESQGRLQSALNFFQMAFANHALPAYQNSAQKIEGILNKDKVKEWLDQANGYFQVRDYEHAASLYEKIIKTDLTQMECFRRLTIVYLDDKAKQKKAREMCDLAKEFFPNDEVMYACSAILYHRSADLKKAQRDLSQAMKINPNSSMVQRAQKMML